MTRDQIIEQLFTGKNFRDAIAKMAGPRLQEDLKMEVISRILEQPEEKIRGLHDRKQLEWYTARIIVNEVGNKYSQFNKKFKVAHVEYLEGSDLSDDGRNERGWKAFKPQNGIAVEIDDIQVREVRELQEAQAIAAIEGLEWYDKELVRLYIKVGSYRAIEAETHIPWESAYKSIQKSLKIIRCQVTKLSSMPL